MQALKRVRAKRRLLVVVLALAILIPAATGALATVSYKVSCIYTEFNVTTKTTHTFPNDANYTLPWRAVMTNKVTYNDTTTSPACKIGFVNAANSSEGVMDFNWGKPDANGKGNLEVYIGEGTSGNLIDTVPFTIDQPLTIYIVADGITIKNSTDIQLEYNFKAFAICNVSASGSVADCATAGFLQIEFSSGAQYGLDIVYSMIPLMVTITVIGMIVKMMDRMGKSIR